jgi:hypothetical protein
MPEPDEAGIERAVSRPAPASPRAPFSRAAQTLAWAVFLTTAVACLSHFWGLESKQSSELEIVGALFASGPIGGIEKIPSAARNAALRFFAISLGLCVAEAGLILFLTGTLPLLPSAAFGMAGFTASFVIISISADS